MSGSQGRAGGAQWPPAPCSTGPNIRGCSKSLPGSCRLCAEGSTAVKSALPAGAGDAHPPPLLSLPTGLCAGQVSQPGGAGHALLFKDHAIVLENFKDLSERAVALGRACREEGRAEPTWWRMPWTPGARSLFTRPALEQTRTAPVAQARRRSPLRLGSVPPTIATTRRYSRMQCPRTRETSTSRLCKHTCIGRRTPRCSAPAVRG